MIIQHLGSSVDFDQRLVLAHLLARKQKIHFLGFNLLVPAVIVVSWYFPADFIVFRHYLIVIIVHHRITVNSQLRIRDGHHNLLVSALTLFLIADGLLGRAALVSGIKCDLPLQLFVVV